MANDIETTAPARAVVKAPVTSGSALAAFIPTNLDDAWRLSGAIATSGMAPKTYGTDQSKIMVGILAGAEVGLTPFVALQSIAVISGNPTLWGDGQLGLVMASGLLEDFEESDDGKEATCRAVRKGRPTPIIRTFSVEDAKVAGLSGKTGPWQQYPKRMRQLRARSFCLRDAFPDVLKGLKSAEEVRDYQPMGGGQLSNGRPGGAVSASALLEHDDEQEDFNPETGEVQTGRRDEDHGDQNSGDETDPRRVMADALILRCDGASIMGDVINAETEFAKHSPAFPDELVEEVDRAIATAKARLKGGVA